MKVKIKTWDELVEEFGVDEECDILIKGNILSKTIEICLPEDRIIEVLNQTEVESNGKFYYEIDDSKLNWGIYGLIDVRAVKSKVIELKERKTFNTTKDFTLGKLEVVREMLQEDGTISCEDAYNKTLEYLIPLLEEEIQIVIKQILGYEGE